MRIRFVTKAQLQVLQASKAEKHLMPDGPIPLFGSLPSAVSRQWGITTDSGWDKDYWTFTYPIAMSSSLSAYIGRASGGGSYSEIIKYLGISELHWTDSGPDGKHGYGDTMYVIIIGY